jgi:hypothetical protein
MPLVLQKVEVFVGDRRHFPEVLSSRMPPVAASGR